MSSAATSSDEAVDVSESMATSAADAKKKRGRQPNFTDLELAALRAAFMENSSCGLPRATELVKQLGLQAKTGDVKQRIDRVKSWFGNFRNSEEGKALLAASNAHA
ncbi:hypothetical protein GQ42DRAFT_165386, partial [Ramicandelaber brevisporus]